MKTTASGLVIPRRTFKQKLVTDMQRNKWKYILMLPVIVYFILFHYKPMYGIVIAFQRYRPALGVSGSEWVGLQNFESLFNDTYFIRSLTNTFSISFLSILFSFPAPILLAIMLNEVKNEKFKKTIQTVSYMPHFVSMVIICGIIKVFTQSNGLLPIMMQTLFGIPAVNWLAQSQYFYAIYIISGIWQEIGWGSIIYLAALSSIDQEQYEAAKIDGAGRLHQIWHITIPGIAPTIIILLILRLGSVLTVGFEKILLLYSAATYDVADVLSTYAYRRGLEEGDYSYSTALTLFNSLVNIAFLVGANKIANKTSNSGLF